MAAKIVFALLLIAATAVAYPADSTACQDVVGCQQNRDGGTLKCCTVNTDGTIGGKCYYGSWAVDVSTTPTSNSCTVKATPGFVVFMIFFVIAVCCCIVGGIYCCCRMCRCCPLHHSNRTPRSAPLLNGQAGYYGGVPAGAPPAYAYLPDNK
eukprot:c52393_g1_i1.p2 GENE.c52393_g1_i1~~c52393_g1_i1.p2  ORF type:complete len:162 (+),score=22.40 c52393_g1_i1:32-487(+)